VILLSFSTLVALVGIDCLFGGELDPAANA